MRRVFLDANVVIDALLEEDENMEAALRILGLAEQGVIETYCSSLSLATASYFMEKAKIDHKQQVERINIYCQICNVTTVDAAVVRQALDSSFTDFEDALQYFSAMTEDADIIVTRNGSDFTHAEIPVQTPAQFLDMMEKEIND
jgi:predicted nucleic acid-binding protein